MNKKNINIKHDLFTLSSGVVMLMGFISGIIYSFFFLFSFMETLGSAPNRLIVIFIILPIMVITGAIMAYLGIGVAFFLWKPFLSLEEVKKFIFEPRTPEEEIPRIINMLFVKPYYTLANLIYPKIEKNEF